MSLHFALLLSGFAALVYETSWTRMLHRVFGVGDLAVATVLAAFFLGLGLGSWAASRYGGRIERPAHVYAVLELIIALYAAASPWLVPIAGTAYTWLGPDVSIEVLSLWRLLLSLGLLLPPTLLMGATLPILLLILAGRDGWARGATSLYVSNTLGAMIGAGSAGLLLIPQLGGRTSTFIAAAASVAAAALVYSIHRAVRVDRAVVEGGAEEEAEDPAEDREDAEPAAGAGASKAAPSVPPRLALLVILAAGTGLAALASEVLWTRVLRTLLHATTQAFASMLLCYLLGIALGALAARRLARTQLGPAIALGLTQALAGVLIVVAMVVVPHIARLVPLLRGELSFVPHRAVTIMLIAGVLLLPLAFASGMGLPLVWALGERGERDAIRGSGRLLAANTLGALVGSLGAGFFLVPAMGIEASLLVVVFVHLAIAGLALRRGTADRAPALRALAFTVPLVLGVGMLLARPSIHLPFLLRAWKEPIRAMLQGPDDSWREPVVFLEEGRVSTVTVDRRPGGLALYNDGRPESGFGSSDPGFGPELGLLGSLPVLFAENTGRALAVGFGGGHTTSVLLAGGYERVDVVELEEVVIAAARLMHEARSTPFPLDDPRAHLTIDDARNRLVLAPRGTYDGIVSQPSHPWLAGSSALYTREFFEEVDRALADGGVLAIWVNLFRIQPRQIRAVVRTLREVFPHVSGFIADSSSLVLAASHHEQRWDARLDERIERLATRYLNPFGLGDRASLARVWELDSEAARALGEGAPTIVDDLPLLEFELAALSEGVHVSPVDFDRALRTTPWWSDGSLWAGPGRGAAIARRIEWVIDRPIALERVAASLDVLEMRDGERAHAEGALAEARGDVRGALAAWDRATDAASAHSADSLRLWQGMPRSAVRIAASRDTAPTSAAPVLRAALRIGDEEALRRALSVAAGVDNDADRPLVRYVEQEATGRCSAWRDDPRAAETLARGVWEVAFRAQGCAFAANDEQAATRLGTLAVRARRVDAEGAFEIGDRCRRGGNGGCALLMLRRALDAYPSHSSAAAALALVLHRAGRRDEAREVLSTCLRETDGIATSQARLLGAAQELGIDLGVALPTPADSPTSTQTGTPGDAPR